MGGLNSTIEKGGSYRCLGTGQTSHISVYANNRWNDSGVDVVSGQIYTFCVPASEKWIDSRTICGADGFASNWQMRPLELFRRAPEANWFRLIATIGRSTKRRIAVGSRLTDFLPPFPGRLYFFANDVPWMYWNNKGVIAVRVTRIQ